MSSIILAPVKHKVVDCVIITNILYKYSSWDFFIIFSLYSQEHYILYPYILPIDHPFYSYLILCLSYT